ncbi:testis-specific gene 13 protein [Dromiciops gliroides]|uniref:testis-specific gene 13 protein n=1 Tax=Dromiciops gliroides TaxID=33562 RepID=UPI001CC6CEB8|nr:testis-specific gene 13 protein [Dromiciops gliroides]
MRIARPKSWRRSVPRDSAKDAETLPDLEGSKEVREKMGGKKHWRKASVKMRVTAAIKATRASKLKEVFADYKLLMNNKQRRKLKYPRGETRFQEEKVQKCDEGKSKFVLANLEHYTIHPNLVQYYEPLKVTEPHKLFGGNQNIKRFMSRVTEFDQNKTLLIMTNNPPPGPVNWQEKDTPPCYFSQELLAKPQEKQKTTSPTGLPLMKKKKLKAEPRTPFPVVVLEDAKPKREQWYRFSTKADLKGEAEYSKLHALKKQREAYPELSFVPDFRSAARDLASRRKVSMVTWEPLTLATLLEEKPTLTVPLSSNSPFRYGRAPQWFINTPTVPN